MKSQLLSLLVIFTCLLTSSAIAQNVVFDASPSNTNIFNNGLFTGGSNSLRRTVEALSFTNTNREYNNSGIVSVDDLNTLAESPLTNNEKVTFTFEVLSINGDIQSDQDFPGNPGGNGIEFGLSPNGTEFRPAGNLLLQTGSQFDGPGNKVVNQIIGGNFTAAIEPPSDFIVTPNSLEDGFTAILEADSNGYTFTLRDIVNFNDASVTEVSYSGPLQGTEFIDNFGSGHIYFGAQKDAADLQINFGEVSVTISPADVTEPSPMSTALQPIGTLMAAADNAAAVSAQDEFLPDRPTTIVPNPDNPNLPPEFTTPSEVANSLDSDFSIRQRFDQSEVGLLYQAFFAYDISGITATDLADPNFVATIETIVNTIPNRMTGQSIGLGVAIVPADLESDDLLAQQYINPASLTATPFSDSNGNLFSDSIVRGDTVTADITLLVLDAINAGETELLLVVFGTPNAFGEFGNSGFAFDTPTLNAVVPEPPPVLNVVQPTATLMAAADNAAAISAQDEFLSGRPTTIIPNPNNPDLPPKFTTPREVATATDSDFSIRQRIDQSAVGLLCQAFFSYDISGITAADLADPNFVATIETIVNDIPNVNTSQSIGLGVAIVPADLESDDLLAQQYINPASLTATRFADLDGNIFSDSISRGDTVSADITSLVLNAINAGETELLLVVFGTPNAFGEFGNSAFAFDTPTLNANRALVVPAVLLGDANCDGIIDFLDIAAFVAILSGGAPKPEADIDQNGIVDFLDITPFIAILSAP